MQQSFLMRRGRWTGVSAGLILFSLAAVLLTACQGTAPPPIESPRQIAQYTINDFLGTTSYGGGSISHDNSKVLLHSDRNGVFNAYSIPITGGEPTQLTQSETDAVFTVGYFPDDDRFLYTSDQGGNELNHLFVREEDGTVQDLTPGENLKANFLGWSQDATGFFVATNERDPKYFDIYEYKVEDYSRELLYQDETGYMFSGISPDRRHIAFAKVNSNRDSDVYVYDREASEMKLITEHEGNINHGADGFSPDGKYIYLQTNEDSEFNYLVRQSLADGTREVVEKPDWDVFYSFFSWQGGYHVVGINNDSRTELRIYKVGEDGSRTKVTLPALPNADVTGVRISRDETHVLYFGTSARNPMDIFAADLAGGEPVQLTRSLNEAIDSRDLVSGEVVRFNSFDGVEIPGILYKPHQASPDNKVPAVVSVHGGPGGQSRIGYSAMVQYLVNHGYAVYAINNRGSTGYGKTFFHMDDRAHGEGDLMDCVSSKQMLIDTGWVDPDKIGIMGGSYGGYMVLAAMAFQPEEFNVGVNIFGVSNWVRTLQSIPPWWEAQRKYLEDEMGDFDDVEYLKSISPLFHADNIVRPLIVLQGANDPRVLQVESDEIVEAVKANGVPVDYIVFPDEGHGFRKKENREKGYKAIRDFLDKYLKNPIEVEQEQNVG